MFGTWRNSELVVIAGCVREGFPRRRRARGPWIRPSSASPCCSLRYRLTPQPQPRPQLDRTAAITTQITRGVKENVVARAREPIEEPVVSRPVETPLQALQRKFVNGAITLEQYEAEIDKLQHLV